MSVQICAEKYRFIGLLYKCMATGFMHCLVCWEESITIHLQYIKVGVAGFSLNTLYTHTHLWYHSDVKMRYGFAKNCVNSSKWMYQEVK